MKSPSILAIGGLDTSGGAGVLTDAAAARSVGVHASVATTTLAIQNNERFFESEVQPPDTFRNTLDALLPSMGFGAVKTGALGNASIVRLLASYAKRPEFPPLVVDPVIRSTSGGVLLEDEGVDAFKSDLLPRAALVTPNLEETSLLTGLDVVTPSDMATAGKRLLELGSGAALIKGGHLDSDTIVDVLVDAHGTQTFESKRIGTIEVRGTGCALASLIASFIAKGDTVRKAIPNAREVLAGAITAAVQVANGPKFLKF